MSKTKYRSKGVEMIAKERLRQIKKEDWTPEHDQEEHDDGSLATAAACYAMPNEIRNQQVLSDPLWYSLWPWDCLWFNPSTNNKEGRLKDLRRAGALIAAEIDRLLTQKEQQ